MPRLYKKGMPVKIILPILLLNILLSSSLALSNQDHINNLTIKKIRTVGNYSSGETYDNSIELWFVTPLTWTNTSCTTTYRVFVDAKHQHIISAAYMAFAAGKKVNINADDSLPIRNGSCEISYLDVVL